MTSTPTACPHGKADATLCFTCFSSADKSRQPSLTSSAIKTLGRLLNMPADELRAKIDAHEDAGIGELVVNAIHPEPRQSDTISPDISNSSISNDMSARDAAAEAYADRISNTLESADARARSFKAGYDAGHAQAIAQMGAEVEQLRVQLSGCGVAAMQNTERSKADRAKPGDYGWSASYSDVCDAVDREITLRNQLTASRERSQALVDALEKIAHNDFGVAPIDIARRALAAWREGLDV